MPNQWVKITDESRLNFGRFAPVRHGRPDENGYYLHLWDLGEFRRRGWDMPHVYRRPDSMPIYAVAKHVELLGPDECARLDAEHGMDGTEGELFREANP